MENYVCSHIACSVPHTMHNTALELDNKTVAKVRGRVKRNIDSDDKHVKYVGIEP